MLESRGTVLIYNLVKSSEPNQQKPEKKKREGERKRGEKQKETEDKRIGKRKEVREKKGEEEGRKRKKRKKSRKKEEQRHSHREFIWGDVHQSVNPMPSMSESPKELHKQTDPHKWDLGIRTITGLPEEPCC